MMFLTQIRQRKNLQNLKLEFPMQIWGEKRNVSNINWKL